MLAQQGSGNNAPWVQLVVILLVAGSGVLRWVFTKLQEQAAKKKAMDQLEAGRTEELRTGRASDPQSERAAVEAQAAARRQAQIEEFRRRQQQRAAQRAGQAAPVPVPTKPAPQARPAPKKPARRVIAPPPEEPEATHALVAQAAPAAAAPRAAASTVAHAAFQRPTTVQDWRRVVVANTVLGKPTGMDGGGDPWSPVF